MRMREMRDDTDDTNLVLVCSYRMIVWMWSMRTLKAPVRRTYGLRPTLILPYSEYFIISVCVCVFVTNESIRIRRYFNDHGNTLCCQPVSGNMLGCHVLLSACVHCMNIQLHAVITTSIAYVIRILYASVRLLQLYCTRSTPVHRTGIDYYHIYLVLQYSE